MDLEQKGWLVAIPKLCSSKACRLTVNAAGALYHGLINRVGGLIRKDAGGEAGDHPDDVDFMRCLQHIIIDADVVSLERREAIHE